MDECDDEEALDPRIQVELETLNKASENINIMELELDKERSLFRQILTDSTHQLNTLAKKVGSCIDKARPYYEIRLKAREAQIKTQDAALRYERACSQLCAAKEMVSLAEEGFFDKRQAFDPAWQEMLNHATMKVNEAENEKIEGEIAHMETAAAYNEIDKEVKMYQKELKRTINKSRPYFEMKAKFSQTMEEQKQSVSKLEKDVNELKRCYGYTLKNLEIISAEIHQQREEAKIRKEMGERSSGVGAESPMSPPNGEEVHRYESHRDTVHRIASRLESQKLDTQSSGFVSQKGLVSTLKRTNSYENAVDLGVTENTQKDLVEIEGNDTTMDIVKRAHTVEHKASQSTKKPFSISLFGTKKETTDIKADQKIVKNSESSQNTDKTSKSSEKSNNNDNSSNQNIQNQLSSSEDIQEEILPDWITTSENVHIRILPHVPGLKAPKAIPEDMTPESEDSPQLQETIITNSEIMTTLQEAKDLGMTLLRPKLSSSNTLEDLASDTETSSMASMNMLDDEQIQSVMHGFEEMEQFASQLDEKELSNWKQMTLPAKLNFLEDYVKFNPLGKADSSEGKNSVKSADGCFVSSDEQKVAFEIAADKENDEEKCSEDYPPLVEIQKKDTQECETGVEITESTYL